MELPISQKQTTTRNKRNFRNLRNENRVSSSSTSIQTTLTGRKVVRQRGNATCNTKCCSWNTNWNSLEETGWWLKQRWFHADCHARRVVGERRKKSKAVCDKSPIKPERFPEKTSTIGNCGWTTTKQWPKPRNGPTCKLSPHCQRFWPSRLWKSSRWFHANTSKNSRGNVSHFCEITQSFECRNLAVSNS